MEPFQRTEAALGIPKLTEYPTDDDEVMVFQPRVEEAQRVAKSEMRTLHEDRDRGRKGSVLKYKKKSGAKRGRDDMDAEEG